MFPSTSWAVTRPEETLATGSIASSPIPTLSHAAMAQDYYRIMFCADTDMSQFNVCFTDVATCVGLARVIEGPIESYADIEAAEIALNAILFHQNVEVFIPTVKVEINNIRTYARPDKGQRSDIAFEMFNIPTTRDWLCAYDYVLVEDGRISRTEREDANLIGITYGDHRSIGNVLGGVAADVFPAFARDFKVPGYFSDPLLIQSYKATKNFTHELYDRISIPWRECVSSVPGVDLSVRLPPLLAIVLTRAQSRQDIPSIVRELHDQLGSIRSELYEFDQMVRTETDQVRLEKKTTKIQESFAAIVPESRENIGMRTLARIWSLSKPLTLAYAIAIEPTLLNPESLRDLIASAYEAVVENSSIVDRTMSGRAFSELLRTDSVVKLLKKHFDDSELNALEKTYRDKQRK